MDTETVRLLLYFLSKTYVPQAEQDTLVGIVQRLQALLAKVDRAA